MQAEINTYSGWNEHVLEVKWAQFVVKLPSTSGSMYFYPLRGSASNFQLSEL